ADDDLTRQAFADWLEERGDTRRAEFIRLQMALARQGGYSRTAEERAEALLTEHRRSWLGDLLSVAPADHWKFERGLPDVLDLRAT
ncbi:TIGR02996 domain-containing protein, partial [Acinetobacter baumannii]